MQRLNKNFSLDIDPNTASERMHHILTTKTRHGTPMSNMRQWMRAGYLLSEFGYGIMEYLLAMDDSRTPEERLKELLGYIDRCNLEAKPQRDKQAVVVREAVKEASPEEVPVTTLEKKPAKPDFERDRIGCNPNP